MIVPGNISHGNTYKTGFLRLFCEKAAADLMTMDN